MNRAELKSVFDAALWFIDHALNDNEYLQPQKLQRLLFLAQAYYAVIHEGRALFPGVFVAEEMGPVEPNVYAAFAKGRPDIEVDLFLSAETEEFMAGVWRRFGPHSADRLNKIACETLAYEKARAQGRRSEITLDMMRKSFERDAGAPPPEMVMRPKKHMTQGGKLVTPKSWAPGKTVNADDARIVRKPEAPEKKKKAQAAEPVDWTAQAKQVSRDAVAAPSRARLDEEKKARLRRFLEDGLKDGPAPPQTPPPKRREP